jgi:hypothetical protein
VLAQYFTHRVQIIVQHSSGRLSTCQKTLHERIVAYKRPLGSYLSTRTWGDGNGDGKGNGNSNGVGNSDGDCNGHSIGNGNGNGDGNGNGKRQR